MSFGKEYNLTVQEFLDKKITVVLDANGVDTRKISSEFPRFLASGKNLSTMFAGLKGMFKNFAKGFLNNLKSKIAGKIGEMAGKLLEGPIKAVKGVLGNIADAAQMAKGQLGDAISNLVGENSGLKQVFSFLPDSVQSSIMNAAGSFGSVFDVVGAGSKAVGGILDNISSGKYILNPSSFKSDVKKIGAFVTAGFENGINNAFSQVVNGIANPNVIMGVAGKVLDSVTGSKDFNRVVDVANTITNGATKLITTDLPNLAGNVISSVLGENGSVTKDIATFGKEFSKTMDTVFPGWTSSPTDGKLSTSLLQGATDYVKNGLQSNMLGNIADPNSLASLNAPPSNNNTFIASAVINPVSNFVNKTVNGASAVANTITNTAGVVLNQVASVGNNISGTIGNVIDNVAAVGNNVGSSVVSAVQNLSISNAPSQAQLNQMFPELYQ